MALRIGIIGTGSMGTMLAKAWATTGDAEVFVYNRTPEKARDLASQAPRIHVAASAQDVARFADVVMVCTKASDSRVLFDQIGDLLAPSQILATTISTIPLATMESWTRARVAKVIPSIVQSIRSGVLLVSYGSRFDSTTQECFEDILCQISDPFPVQEAQLRVCSDLTSCGPAFFAEILNVWAEAASKTGQISRGEAEYLITQTFTSAGRLFASGMSASDVLEKVAVPGGVTAVGVQVLEAPLRDMFQALHTETEQHSRNATTEAAPEAEALASGPEG